jgi:uncharacterized membrane protein
MNKYPDFWGVLFGKEPQFFAAYSVLSILSAVAIIAVLASRKYKSIPDSPDKWSWKYFWADNLGKFVAGFILLPLFVRVVYEYAEGVWMLLISIGMGFGFLGLSQIAENFGLWTTKKLSQKIADKINSEQTKP